MKALKQNTLVRHIRLTQLGIGCVAKAMRDTYMVNWGLDKSNKCKRKYLVEVDVSKGSTIKFDEFQKLSVTNSPKIPKRVILGNVVKEYVGIGWIDIKIVEEEDIIKYPRVV